jgi:diadenosine tetraphosphate (Ap4A) HIT family hydrolase
LANGDRANQDVRQPVAKKIAKAIGAEDFNVLQNNGRIAHQVVDHVSFS